MASTPEHLTREKGKGDGWCMCEIRMGIARGHERKRERRMGIIMRGHVSESVRGHV